MNIKKFSLFTAIAGFASVACGVLCTALSVYWQHVNGPISIIGTLDVIHWFTYLRVRGYYPLVLLGVALLLTALFCAVFGKSVTKCCTVNTTVLSLLVSAAAAIMLMFIRLVWGIVFAILPLALIALYILIRRKHKSVAGVVIDALTCLAYLPFFCCAFENLFT